jgi:acyl carrier protein
VVDCPARPKWRGVTRPGQDHANRNKERSNVSDEANLERFKKCAVDILSVDASKLTLDAKFSDDLDADSLDLVELVMALEEEFDVSVEEEELEGIETVGQAFELIKSKLG